MKKLLLTLALLALPALASAASLSIQGIYPTGSIEPGTTVTFFANASGFSNPSYSVSGGGSIDIAGNYTWTPAVANAGRNTITVTVSDPSGASSTATAIIQVTADSLVISAPSPAATVAAGKQVTFTISAPGFISPTFFIYDGYTGNNYSIGSVDANGNFSWTVPLDEAGLHRLTISATDPYGHNAQGVQNITVVNPKVILPIANPITTAVGIPVVFTATSSGMVSPAFSVADNVNSYSTTTMTSSAMSSTGFFSWTPAVADVGLHTIVVTATDSLGNAASTTGNIVVGAAGSIVVPPPVATSTTPAPSISLPPSTSVIPAYKFLVLLTVGSRGAGVIALQNRLIAAGYLSAGNNSGYFGLLTSAAVKKFQKTHGLAQVGFVGPGTRAALNSGQ